MLLSDHIQHTKKALASVDLSSIGTAKDIANAKEQILFGCEVNDLLELTSEVGGLLLGFLHASDMQGVVGAMAASNGGKGKLQSFLYQSHYGSLASLHVMAVKAGAPAKDTWNQVGMWWSFLQGVFLGTVRIKPSDSLEKTATPIQPLFQGLDQPMSRLFDTAVPLQIKYRSLGMLMHLIQDSFTPSHCFRTDDGKLGEFYAYKSQDSGKHSAADHVLPKFQPLMEKHLQTVLASLLKGTPVDYFTVFNLKKDAMSADGGEYVK